MATQNQTYSCTNGTLKDGSKTYQCPSQEDEKYCYDNSYTYCKKLTSTQIRNLIIIGVTAFIVVIIINSILSRIPIIGFLISLAINLLVLGVVGIIVYVVYMNYKTKPNPPKK